MVWFIANEYLLGRPCLELLWLTGETKVLNHWWLKVVNHSLAQASVKVKGSLLMYVCVHMDVCCPCVLRAMYVLPYVCGIKTTLSVLSPVGSEMVQCDWELNVPKDREIRDGHLLYMMQLSCILPYNLIIHHDLFHPFVLSLRLHCLKSFSQCISPFTGKYAALKYLLTHCDPSAPLLLQCNRLKMSVMFFSVFSEPAEYCYCIPQMTLVCSRREKKQNFKMWKDTFSVSSPLQTP